MKQLFIFIGPPAGGKTTAARELARRIGNSQIIEVDEIKKRISGSVFGKDDSERERWFREVNNQILVGLKNHDNVAVDEGFFEQKYLDKITSGVSSEVRIIIIEITLPLEEHLKRNQQRGDNPESVKRMYEIWNQLKQGNRIKADVEIHKPNLNKEQIVELILNKTSNR